MAKMLLHDDDARIALARGVATLTRAIRGTLGPKGMNAIIDRPIGTPMISRDGVSIADEIELPDRFENMGAQVVREVAGQTNAVAGDGTTTATVLADAMIEEGMAMLGRGYNAVDVVAGMDAAVERLIEALKTSAVPLDGPDAVAAVATIGANDPVLGRLIAEAVERVGPDGTVSVEHGLTVESTLEVAEGMSFDRGYISHHMVTDVERMQAVLENPLILLTDHKIRSPEEIEGVLAEVNRSGRPLLLVAEEISPETLVTLLSERTRPGCRVAAIHPPEFGHWRKSTLEDLAILTGGRVIARELGERLEGATLADLGGADQVRISASETIVRGGHGEPDAIAARRAQVSRHHDAAPENIERDKLAQRLARLSGGTAVIFAGGATPVEQKRRGQMIEDALNAARAAAREGVVPGGGTALLQLAPRLDELTAATSEGTAAGVELVRRSLERPLRCIATNCGLDADELVRRVRDAPAGVGLDARTGSLERLVEIGVVDPVRVTYTALRNAASVAGLILTTQTLIADRPEHDDPTAGPALGGGGELLE